jgi:hypothetical protein
MRSLSQAFPVRFDLDALAGRHLAQRIQQFAEDLGGLVGQFGTN